jgi:hypothetical protein
MKDVMNELLLGWLVLTVVGALSIVASERAGAAIARGLWRLGYAAAIGAFVTLAGWVFFLLVLEPPPPKYDMLIGSLIMIAMGALLAFLPLGARSTLDSLGEHAARRSRWIRADFARSRTQVAGWFLFVAGLAFLGGWLVGKL